MSIENAMLRVLQMPISYTAAVDPRSPAAVNLGAPAATSNSSTCGRVKLLHPGGGTDGTLVGGWVLGNAAGGFLEPPALSFELEQAAVMHESVEQRGDDDHVAEEFRPVLEWPV